MKKGKFISIDGPNGVGKSTLIEKLKLTLSDIKYDFLHTKEVTNSSIGQLIHRYLGDLTPNSLACLIAADRYNHIETKIKPNLLRGINVISERYFPSSLVYQIIDGCSLDFVKSINNEILIPDISIIINASTSTLERRLKSRIFLDKFEQVENNRTQEVKLFNKAEYILKELNWNVMTIDNSDGKLEHNVNTLKSIILNL
ncbi:MAG: dTMP kinase [Flavobacteriaceae bacterium]|nr:dTMP kinase [Flavobacteriaceae bacterium]